MTAEHKEDARNCYERALEYLGEGEPQVALRILARALQFDPGYRQALQLAVDILDFVGRGDEAELFRAVLKAPEDSQGYFDLGYHFSDVGLYELAEAFFRKSLDLLPDDPLIHYELGFCLSRLSHYAEAISHLEAAFRQEEAAEAALLMSYCHLLLGHREEACELLKKARSIGLEDDQVAFAEDIAAGLKRFATEPSPFQEGLREWHYIQYGGILLEVYENTDLAGGRFTALWTDYIQVARILKRALTLFERWNLSFGSVLYHGERSGPLGVALGTLLNIPARPYQEASSMDGSHLIVVASSQDLEDIREDLYPHRPDATLFAFSLDWTRLQPVAPEVVGMMARLCEMPWGEQLRILEPDRPEEERRLETIPPDTRPVEEIAQDILNACCDPDPGCEEMLAFYQFRKPYLLLGNPERYPRRPVFSPDSPVPGAQFS